ncbi:hypothetical protein B296_00054948 [Ensete ventricosum]|uniref:Uncharacterized protein n=1 Tax=Ensete ventricosum TaxID=4639 RepID=A0A426Y1T3_ENSVE|nr:hypothetical protein B296_00054948 [Ensete ventricosum]
MHCAYRLVPVPYRYRQYVDTSVRIEGKQYQVCPGESMCDVEAETKTKVDVVNAVNDGDESSSRHLRNSPNLSETVVDDVQESSRERDGEEEGIDHDAKSDEMSVLDILEGICYRKMTKPLTEHAPRVLHQKDGRSRIFYGNTSFYLLFRFHQVRRIRFLVPQVEEQEVVGWYSLLTHVPGKSTTF